MKNNSKFIFFNLNIGETLTGIEHAQLRRASIFNKYLNINPTLVFFRYNPQLAQNIERLKKLNKADSDIEILNLYDYIQGFTKTCSNNNPTNFDNLEFNKININDNIDYKYVDKNNKTLMYVVHNQESKKITHINYFNQGKFWRRDKYHYNGLLSSSQFLDPTSRLINYEIFYNSKQKAIMYKYYSIRDNKTQLQQINILNKNLEIEKILFKEEELVDYILEKFISNSKEKNFFIISDRSKFTFEPILNLKEKFSTKKFISLPFIHSTHTINNNDTSKSKIKSHYTKIFENLTNTDMLLTLTSKQNIDIKNRFGLNKITTIPHTHFTKHNINDKNIIKGNIVYIARLSPEKNHLSAIRIFSNVLKVIPWAKLNFYGSGSEKKKILELIAELNLQDSIILHNYVEDVDKEYLKANLSIVTSKMEGFSLSLVESISMGCPCIAYDINYGPSDIIKDGYNGFLIPYENEKLFSKKIIEILQNDNLYEKMSENSLSHFEKNFSAEKISNIWRDIIERFKT